MDVGEKVPDLLEGFGLGKAEIVCRQDPSLDIPLLEFPEDHLEQLETVHGDEGHGKGKFIRLPKLLDKGKNDLPFSLRVVVEKRRLVFLLPCFIYREKDFRLVLLLSFVVTAFSISTV